MSTKGIILSSVLTQGGFLLGNVVSCIAAILFAFILGAFCRELYSGPPARVWRFAALNLEPAPAKPFTKANVLIAVCAFSMWTMLPFSSGAKLWFNGF